MKTVVVVHGRDQLAQKASQTFFGSNMLVHQSIVKSISNSYLDSQWLANKTTHFSIIIIIIFLFQWVIAKLRGYLALKPT